MHNLMMEQDTLESFLNETNSTIARSTLAKYVSDGLMLSPKRLRTPGSLHVARIYYNPLSAIEAIVAMRMVSGAIDINSTNTSVAKFTAEDVFWSRLNFYIQRNNSISGISTDGFLTTIRFPKKAQRPSIEFPVEPDVLHYIYDTSTIQQDSLYNAKIYLAARFKAYQAIIPDPLALQSYINCSNTIYMMLFHQLESMHANYLTQFATID